MSLYLSIDMGTTGTKAAIVSDSGSIKAKESYGYPMDTPHDGWGEQDCNNWLNALCSVCNRLDKNFPQLMKGVQGVGICGQMHTHVYIDGRGRVLRPAITWMDQRSAKIVKHMNSKEDIRDRIFKQTANILTTTYTAPQVKWVFQNEPGIKQRTRHILLAKDYIKFFLTGEMVTDYSDAAGTLLFDVANKCWSGEMFSLFGIKDNLFPSAGKSSSVIGKISSEASKKTKIPAGIPVINGASDNSCAALGTGMISEGEATLVMGTAGVISRCSNNPFPDNSLRTLCWNYCLEDKWINLGITQTAGESLNWFKNAFEKDTKRKEEDIFQEYNRKVESVPDGSGGLIFLPYLNGERTPYWDSAARGIFFNIALSTSMEFFIKAIMEGVSFALRSCMEAVEDLGVGIEDIRAVGGGVNSPQWLDILSKIINKPIYTSENVDSGLIGNLILIKKSFSKDLDLEKEVRNIVKLNKYQNSFSTKSVAVYEKQYRLFLGLYERVKDLFG